MLYFFICLPVTFLISPDMIPLTEGESKVIKGMLFLIKDVLGGSSQ